MPRTLKIFSAILFGLLALVIAVSSIIFFVQKKKLLSEIELEQKQVEIKILDIKKRLVDLSAIKIQPVFAVTDTLRDAGYYLNKRWKWGNSNSPSVRVNDFERRFPNREVISLPVTAAQWALENISQSLRDLKPFEGARVDTGWFSELLQFNHWEILKNSPNEGTPEVSLVSYEVPASNEVEAWVAFRYLQGIVRGEYDQAIKEIRHFASLWFSQETTVGLIVGYKIFEWEREWYQKCLNSRFAASCIVEPIPAKNLNYLKTQHALVYNMLNPTLIDQHVEFLKKLPWDSGVCHAANEHLASGILLKFLLHERYKKQYKAWNEFAKGLYTVCKNSMLKMAWSHPESTDFGMLYSGRAYDKGLINEESSPIERVMIATAPEYMGLVLLSLGSPKFDKYFIR